MAKTQNSLSRILKLSAYAKTPGIPPKSTTANLRVADLSELAYGVFVARYTYAHRGVKLFALQLAHWQTGKCPQLLRKAWTMGVST